MATKRVNVSTYVKNVQKSAGYIAKQTIKGINPTLFGYVSENADAAKEMYQNVRDFKRNFRGKVNDFLDSEYGKMGKEIAGNALSDLKTGKWYNADRIAAGEEAMMKSMGFDFSDDFDWDKFDEDLSNEGSSPSDVTNDTVQGVGDKISSVTAMSIGSSADRLTKVGKLNTRATLKQIEYSAGMINNSLAAINSTLLNFHNDIAKPLDTHITNSMNFYTTATDELSKQTALLQNIYNMMEERYNPKKKSGFGSYKSSPWEDIFGEGLPNFREWGKHIKNKSKDSIGMITMFADMFNDDFIKSGIMGSEAANSPIAFLLTSALSAGIRNTRHGRSFNRLNDTIANAFAQGMSRVHYTAKNSSGIKRIIADLLDITPKVNNKFNTRYDTGRTDWNGMDDKALREVIPTQLAQILSALTGEEPKIFNYNTGRWTTASGAYRSYQNARKSTVVSAGSGFREDAVKKYSREYRLDTYSNASQSFSKDLENLIQYIGTHNVEFASITTLKDILEKDKMLGPGNKFPINSSNFDKLIKLMQKDPALRTKLTSAGYAAVNANNRFMANTGNDNSGLVALRNGSGLYKNRHGAGTANNVLMSMTDNKGNNIFFYLQHYYRELSKISNALANGSRFTANATSRSVNGGYDFEVPDNTKKGRNNIILPNGQESTKFKSQTLNMAGGVYVTHEYYDPTSGTGKGDSRATNKVDRDKMDYDKELSRYGLYNKAKGWFKKLRGDEDSPTFIDRFGDRLTAAIIGDENDPEILKGGLFGLIKNLPFRIGTALKDIMLDPIRELVKGLLDKAKDKVGAWWQRTKNTEGWKRFSSTFKSAPKNFLKDAFSSTYKNVKSGFAATMGDNGEINTSGQNARGGHVVKSGVVSVSEGEYIVPAENNPYYKGKMSNSQRYNEEAKNAAGWLSEGGEYDDFWGMYKSGGKVKRNKKQRRRHKRYKSKTFNTIYGATKAGKKVAEKAVEFGKEEAQNIAEDINDMAENSETVQEARSTISKALGGFSRAVEDSANKIFGKDTINGAKQTAKGISGLIKPYLPETLAGGAIGALIGAAATGSGLGLLGGFVIGGGVSLITRSDTLQKTIFGEEDETGQYSGGLLNKKVATFLKKRFPRMAKSGAVGSVLGLLGIAPGGLLGGFALGAGLDLLSGTDQFKDFLFGHKGVDGKRRGGMLGSLQVRVVDPLAEFVQKGLKNLDEYVKKAFINPVAKLGTALFDWTKGMFTTAAKALFGGISDKVVKPLAKKLDTVFGIPIGIAKTLGKLGFYAGRGLIRLPFRAMGGIGNALERHNIRRGYTHLNADERMALEGTGGIGFGKFKVNKFQNDEYTKWVQNATQEELEEAYLYNTNDRENRKQAQSLRQDLSDSLIASMNQGGMGKKKSSTDEINERKAVSQLKKIMNSEDVRISGDITPVINWINSQVRAGRMSQEVGEQAIEYAQNRIKQINKLNVDNKEYQQKKYEWNQRMLGEGKDFLVGLQNKGKEGHATIRTMKTDLAWFNKRSDTAKAEYANKVKAQELLKQQLEADPAKAKELGYLKAISEGIRKITQSITGQNLSKDATDPTKPDSDNKPGTNKDVKNTKEKQDKKLSVDEPGVVEDKKGNNEDNKETILTEYGPAEMIENEDGTKSLNMRDSTTNKTEDARKKDVSLRSKFYSTFVGPNGLLSSIKGLFGFGKNGEEGEGKKKKSGGILSSLFGAITGSSIGKIALGIGGLAIGGKVLDWLKTNHPEVLDGIKNALGSVAQTVGDLFKEYAPVIVQGVISGLGTVLSTLFSNLPGIITGALGLAKGGIDTVQDVVTGRDPSTYDEDDVMDPYLTDNFVQKGVVRNMLIRGDSVKVAKALRKIPIIKRIPGMKTASRILEGSGHIRNGILNFPKNAQKALYKGADLVSGLDNITKSDLGTKIGTKIVDFADNPIKAVKNVGAAGLNKLKSTSIGGKVVSTTTDLAKKVASNMKATGKGITTAASNLAEKNKFVSMIVDALKGIIDKVAGLMKKNVAGDAVETVVKEGAEEMAEQAAKKGGSNVFKNLLKSNPFMIGVSAAKGALDGWMTPRAILEVTDGPSITDRLLAAVVNGINEAIPVIGGIIPTNWIISFALTIGQMLGLVDEDSAIMQRREAAKQEVAEYNKANGKTYTVSEYVKNVLGEKTIGEHVVGGLKKAGSAIAGFFGFGKDKEEKELEAAAEVATNGDTSTTDYVYGSTAASSNSGMPSTSSSSELPAQQAAQVKSLTGSVKKNTLGIGKAIGAVGSGAVGYVTGSVGNRIGGLVDTAKGAFGVAGNVGKAGLEALKLGMKVSPIGLATLGIKAIKDGPEAALQEFGEGIQESFKTFQDIIGSPKDFSITGIIKKLMDSTDPNKDKNADKEASNNALSSTKDGKPKSLLASLNDLVYGVLRALLSPVLGIVKGIRSIFGFLTGDSTGESETDSAVNKATTNVDTTEINDTASGSGSNSDTDKYGGVFGGVRKWWDKTILGKDVSGSGSGIHVSQRDSKYSGKRFGKTTIGKNGCGPAAAATVLRTYGKNADLSDVADYAQANGFVAGSSGVGTKAGYFKSILGKNGISSKYTTNRGLISDAVGSGSPTILLGQDKNNTSKTNSPFGPNPHYVVAQGKDANGNIVVDDPELKGPAIYNKNILNNAKLGIMTGGASELPADFVSPDELLGTQRGNIMKVNAGTNVTGASLTPSSDTTITTKSNLTKEANELKEAAKSSDGDYIGKWVKKYESGDKGSLAISKGTGDHGGVSFGSYQFPTNRSASDSLWRFWEKYYQKDYPGITIGNNQAFKDAWTEAVNKDPTGFFKNEHDFMVANYFTPITNDLKSNGVGDPSEYDRAAQEAAWSTAVQYGPGTAAKLFAKAGINNSMNPKDYISQLYDYKYNHVESNFKSSPSFWPGLRSRFKEEKELLLGLTGNDPIDPNTVNGVVSLNGSSTESSSSTSSSSSSGNDLGSIINSIFGAMAKAVGDRLGGTLGGLISTIFGGSQENQTTQTSTDSSWGTTTGIDGDYANSFPYYAQYDPRWADTPYGKEGTIKSAGCGPTSMAMVMKSYGSDVDPRDTAQWAVDNGYRVYGQGTSWDYFKAIGNTAGLTTNAFTGVDQAKQYLQLGIPVIGSMRPGTFKRGTSGGHFIVFSGIKGSNVTVNDPGSGDLTKTSHNADSALSEAKQFWAISKDGKGSIGNIATTVPEEPDAKDYDLTDYGQVKDYQEELKQVHVAGSSGLPLYDFTKMKSNYSTPRRGKTSVSRYKNYSGGASNVPVLDSGISSKLDQILEVLKTIMSNSYNSTYLPAILEVIKAYGNTLSKVNNSDYSAAARESINQDISSMMTKLDTIAASL